MQIPAQFTNQITKAFGVDGHKWLQLLPKIINYSINKWQLKNVVTVGGLSNNYVAYGYSDIYKSNIVLKISTFGKEFQNEKSALLYFNGHGVNRLLDYDNTYSILLLEKIGDGVTLSSLFPENENQAIRVATSVINQLHSTKKPPKEDTYPTLSEYVTAFDIFTHHEIHNELISFAQNLSSELLCQNRPNYLLHGDLHHFNIISSADGSWTSIDPHGVIGPIEYEIGAFIRNPVPDIFNQNNLQQLLTNRFNLFSELLGLDRKLLIQYSYMSTMLAIIWDIENNGDFYSGWLDCLKIIKRLI